MNYELNEDQTGILGGLEQLITSLNIEVPHGANFYAYGAALDAELSEGGFLSVTEKEGFSLLDGALVVERLAQLALSVEAASSILVAPLVLEDAPHPVAIGQKPAS